jgi:hypothetical protein
MAITARAPVTTSKGNASSHRNRTVNMFLDGKSCTPDACGGAHISSLTASPPFQDEFSILGYTITMQSARRAAYAVKKD